MEKLILHIERLLGNNDHVIVPGLGGFAVQHQSAVISNKSIFPPTAIVGFNPLMHHNDGLLAIEVSRYNKISYREAMAIIASEVNEFMLQLETNVNIPLGQLGYFRKSDSTLLFMPAECPAFLPYNLGLNTIHTRQNANNTESRIRQRKMNATWMKYAAIFILLIGLVLPSSVNEYHNINTADFNILNNIELSEVVITAQAPATVPPDEVEYEEIATASIETNSTESKAKPQTPQLNYQVVVAVLQSESNAERFAAELRSGHYPSAVVIALSGNYAIAVSAFSDIIPAVNYMENLRHQEQRFKDAWVMKIQ